MAVEPNEELDAGRGGEVLPRTLLRFCEELRRGGIPVSTSSVMDALNAVVLVDIFSRMEFYNTLLATLVKRKEDQILFDNLFHSFWHTGQSPDRKSTRLNSSHIQKSRMPSSA